MEPEESAAGAGMAPPPPPGARVALPPGPGPRRVEPLNLSRRPFLNARPVVRVALLLWLTGVLLLLGNVSLFWGYLQKSADKRAQLERGRDEIARQQTADRQLQGILDSFKLAQQNERIDFLNKQIAERTFSWSQLLNHIVAALPNDVRLNRLAPQTGDKAQKEIQRARAKRGRAQAGIIPIMITGEARSDEALHAFVDNLFDPPFTQPDLVSEEREDSEGNFLKFEGSVQYIPGASGGAVIEEIPGPTIQEVAPPPAAAPATPPPSGGRP